jgi:predicted AAA+ superfamily ATPase
MYLLMQNIPTPFSILLNGELGAGKISLMKTRMQKVKDKRIKIMWFNAWQYEGLDPRSGLLLKYLNNIKVNPRI